MVLSISEKVFVVEHYSHSYGESQGGAPSVQMAHESFEQEFHKGVPNKANSAVASEKFRKTGSVLLQHKHCYGRKWTSTDKAHMGEVVGVQGFLTTQENLVEFRKRTQNKENIC
jgi:outer membrane scaffolding protein for murein synthesis (MipA/OmpV family)